MNKQGENTKAVNFWQIVILVLSIYVLAALAVEWLFNLPASAVLLLRWIDTAICIIFLFDFFTQLWRAESKLRYLQWGWIDLASSIPFFPLGRWGRLVRIARILMILRSARSAKVFLSMIFKSPIRGTFLSILLATVVLVIVSAVAILICEKVPDANIKTAGDAFWWSFSTVTSAGYGDLYPVTWEGRLVAAVLMTAGVAFFSTLIAYIFSLFTDSHQKERDDKAILEELQQLRKSVDSLLGKNQPGDSAGRDKEQN